MDRLLLYFQKFIHGCPTFKAALDTVDYTLGDEVVLRVAAEERSRCILQIGTNSAEPAFELSGQNFGLCPRMVVRCGVSAVAVHGRQRDERPKDQCRVAEINQNYRSLSIPVFANGFSGSIHSYEDLGRFYEETEASGVMDIQNFLQKVCQYDESFTGSKMWCSAFGQLIGIRSVRSVDRRVLDGPSNLSHLWHGQRKVGESLENGPRTGGLDTPQDQTDDDDNKRPRNYDDEQLDDKVPMLKMVDGVRVAQLSFHPKCLKYGVNEKLTLKCVLSNHYNSMPRSIRQEAMNTDS
uniref:DUS-like FMN-binding domain-containing protein n=1 Tax=Globodera rostochiensis TaxID=31243 RepID=A0A914HH82_GLORO